MLEINLFLKSISYVFLFRVEEKKLFKKHSRYMKEKIEQMDGNIRFGLLDGSS